MEHFLSKIDDLCFTHANYVAVSANVFWGKFLIWNKSEAAPYIESFGSLLAQYCHFQCYLVL